MYFLSIVFFIVIFVRGLQGSTFEYLFDDPELFRKCSNQPENVLSIDELFDTSELHRFMDNDIINMSGNLSVASTWKIKQTDRIMVHISAYHWEVGAWQPTIYNIIIQDACKAFNDPQNYFYVYLTKHIINKDTMMEKCIYYPGTKYFLEPHDIRFNITSYGLPFHGRYKVEFKIDV
ncbi:uncharacterized protein LOC124460359 [Drosophila willistoni]|uniref:uncharacterized protein LOC124460359 n=1 Tax=Drosophila willistoni TaxID=7260 RepID=UPI001F0854E4|nr:uncharacterized protein LOC124460359 [Drosophila willistoni]